MQDIRGCKSRDGNTVIELAQQGVLFTVHMGCVE